MAKRERTGKQKQGKYVTQKDVAKEAGVSPSIVSYVINDGPRSISEETRARVLRAIAELDYHPNIHAQQLMLAQTESELASRQFGIVVSGPRSILLRPYYPRVIYGIMNEAPRMNMIMRFLMFMDELENPLTFNKLFHHEEISAAIVILAGTVMSNDTVLPVIDRIKERIPNVVTVGFGKPSISYVMYDLKDAVYQSTRHLIRLGHQRIAYIGTPRLRLEGFVQAINENGLDLDSNLVFVIPIENTSQNGYERARELIASGLLAGPSPVSAIVAASDEVAWGVIRAMHEANLRVPEDISIIGVDNHELSGYQMPALTTMNLPMEQVGLTAMQIIAAQAEKPDTHPIGVSLPSEIIIRQSCRPYQRPA